MTERSFPFVDGATTDAEFSAMFKQIFPASVIDGLEVSADSTGMQVKLAVGAAYVRGHYYANKDPRTLTIEAAGSSPRIDTIALRLEYGSANSITALVKTGTAAAEPEAPALTQTDTGVYEFALADVRIAANAVTVAAGDVTDRRVMYIDALKKYLGLLSMAASVITSGVFAPERIPSLPASRITSGIFGEARIPHIAGSEGSVYLTTSRDGTLSAGGRLAVNTSDEAWLLYLAYNDTTVLRFDMSGVMQQGVVPVDRLQGTVPAGQLPNAEWLNNNIRAKSYGGNSPTGSSPGDNRLVAIDPAGTLGVLEDRLSAGYTGVFVQSSAPSNPSPLDLWVW